MTDASATATKRCTKCGETKPLDAFSKDRKRKDGMHSSCRTCTSAEGKAWYAANRNRVCEASLAKRKAARAHRKKANDALRARRAANPEKNRETARLWREANREKIREAKKVWLAANPKKVREYNKRRRAIRLANVSNAAR